MASTAPAYRYTERAPKPAPDIHVVPGRGRQADTDTLSSSVLFLAKAFAVLMVVFAVLGFVRIGLASATVNTAVATEEVSSQIDSVRSAGNDLEVRDSHLSNSSNIKSQASDLKMAEATEVTVINLPADVVTTDAAGNLSLSGSLKAAALSQG